MKQQKQKRSAFDDLGLDKSEAANLKIRAALMRAIEKELDKRCMTQTEAAKLLDITQPRVSDLLRGKIQLFTIDTLITILSKLGKPVALIIDDRIAA